MVSLLSTEKVLLLCLLEDGKEGSLHGSLSLSPETGRKMSNSLSVVDDGCLSIGVKYEHIIT